MGDISGGQSLSIADIAQAVLRQLENYNPQLYSAGDNETTYVTICDIIGRGILTTISANGDGSSDAKVTVKITIDAGTPIEEIIGKIPSAGGNLLVVLLGGFDTSCKVEMKIDASSVIQFNVATLEE